MMVEDTIDCDAIASRVEPVLRSLSLRPEMEDFIHDMAVMLVWNGPTGEPPPAKTRGDKAAIRELDRLVKQIEAVQASVGDLSKEAGAALAADWRYPLTTDEEESHQDYTVLGSPIGRIILEGFKIHAIRAKARLEAKHVKARAGRTIDVPLGTLSVLAMLIYETLTGKRATVTVDPTKRGNPRSGEFLDFLAALFNVMEIKASPQAQAVAAIRGSRPTDRPGGIYAMMFEEILSRKGRQKTAPKLL
jgi:hypothetical protein